MKIDLLNKIKQFPLFLVFFFLLISCSSTDIVEKNNNAVLKGNPYNIKSNKNYGIQDKFLLETLHQESEEILLDIAHSSYLLPKAQAFCYLGDFKRAYKILENEKISKEKREFFWMIKGNCAFLKKDFLLSEIYYQKVLSENVQNFAAINNMGLIAVQKGEDQKALTLFQKAHEFSPYSLVPMFNLANIYLHFGLTKRSKILFENLYRLTPKRFEVVSGLMLSYLSEDMQNEASALVDELDDGLKEKILEVAAQNSTKLKI